MHLSWSADSIWILLSSSSSSKLKIPHFHRLKNVLSKFIVCVLIQLTCVKHLLCVSGTILATHSLIQRHTHKRSEFLGSELRSLQFNEHTHSNTYIFVLLLKNVLWFRHSLVYKYTKIPHHTQCRHTYNFDCPAEILATIERAWDFGLRGLCKGNNEPFDYM